MDSLKFPQNALPAIINVRHAIQILSLALLVQVIEYQLAVYVQQAIMMMVRVQNVLKNMILHYTLNNCLVRLLQQPLVQQEFQLTEPLL